MSRYTYLIGSGHGGLIDGEYVTAPRKMFKHSNGEIVYEGVINRIYKHKLIKALDKLGVWCIDVCPTQLDLSLSLRVKIINEYAKKYNNCVLISLHSNKGKGTGFEIWTSKGETKSDKFAQMLSEEFIRLMPDIRFRSDTFSDGDLDKEADFYILKYSSCPAILPEILFYDNWKDYKKFINPEFQDRVINVFVEWVKKTELTVI